MNLIQDSYISFVNLAHRTDRLKRMEKNLAAVGVPAVRTPGMLPSEYKGDPARVEVMRKRTPGAIGCHFSQVKIMEEALRQQKHAWVMEDDLDFCADFKSRIPIFERFLESRPWDIFWMGGTVHIHEVWWHKNLGFDASRTDDPRVIRTYGAFCTYAYLVNRDSISRILDMLDQLLDRSIGIDWAMIQMQPKLQTFMMLPGAVKQMDNRSDIGKGDTIFSNFKKLGAHWWAENMDDFNPETYDWGFCK